jgi:FkbM family methyltransferase
MTDPITVYSNIYNQNITSYYDYIFKNSIYKDELWEKHLCEIIEFFMKDNTDFVDVGANIGLISLGLKQILKYNNINKKINTTHCFECNSQTFVCLEKNTGPHNDIKIYNIALSDCLELCNMSLNYYNQGANFIKKSITTENENDYNYSYILETNIEKNNVFFLSLNLDSIMYVFKNDISVIKIDVEGYEYKVLLGCKNFLEKFKPVIIVEANDVNFINVHNLLSNYNYIFIVNENLNKDKNYIYIHNDKQSLYNL